jgi:hypothetical protein
VHARAVVVDVPREGEWSSAGNMMQLLKGEMLVKGGGRLLQAGNRHVFQHGRMALDQLLEPANKV